MSQSSPKFKQVVYRPPRPTAWLWFTSLVILLVAAGIILVLRQRLPDPDAVRSMRLVGAGAAVLVGLCVISATANRWIKH